MKVIFVLFLLVIEFKDKFRGLSTSSALPCLMFTGSLRWRGGTLVQSIFDQKQNNPLPCQQTNTTKTGRFHLHLPHS